MTTDSTKHNPRLYPTVQEEQTIKELKEAYGLKDSTSGYQGKAENWLPPEQRRVRSSPKSE